MFSYFKNSIVNTLDFLKGTTAYFRDVLLMHGFMLFVLLPLLTSLSKLVLKEGGIDYISYDNLGAIATQHPYVLLTFLLIGLLILLALFFEFTFLLLSVYFIKKKQPITLTQLLHGTLLQIKKVRGITFLFFLAYFFLILPLSGLTFRSYLLTRVKIPAFILDFIFANRVIIIIGFVLLELIILYLAIRLAFALPELILRDVGFRESLKRSWQITKRRFFQILGQFIIIGGTVLGIFTAGYFLIFLGQTAVETFKPEWSLPSAVIAMTLLQVMMLLNLVLSSVAIFYIIVDDMEDEEILPDMPEWFTPKSEVRVEWTTFRVVLFCLIAIIFGIGVGTYNTNYLSHTPDRKPVTISHRGVNGSNGVQNTLDSLIETNKAKPDYVEMDIQETKDHQFIVMHDFNLRTLTGVNKRPNQLTLKELTNMNVTENGQTAKMVSFDDYLAKANQLKQRLLIEIKTTPQDSPDLVQRFVKQYRENILENGHILHTLTYDTAMALKKEEPRFYVGYVIPFNIVGPPKMPVDFFTMEYSTMNRNFVNAAHHDGKKVYAWTANDEDVMTRMIFYGVDGIITDQLSLLNETMKTDLENPTYSDKLLNFAIGMG